MEVIRVMAATNTMGTPQSYSFKVKLNLKKSIHIGSGQNINEIIDIPITSEIDENGNRIPIVHGTVLKGILRNAGYSVAIHIFPDSSEQLSKNYKVGEEIPDGVKSHPFYSLFGCENYDGKLVVSEGKLDYAINEDAEKNINKRTGIHINPFLQCTMPGALFTLECVEIVSLTFEINCFNLTDEELGLLYGSINALKFHCVGGKRTIGMGIIESVEILDRNNEKNPTHIFITNGEAKLKSILLKKGGKS